MRKDITLSSMVWNSEVDEMKDEYCRQIAFLCSCSRLNKKKKPPK